MTAGHSVSAGIARRCATASRSRSVPRGPKTLHLGGRIFDGVIAGTGLLPEVISDTVERVAAGARAAGRDPSEAEIWFTTRSSLDSDRDKAIERIHASVSSILNHSMRFSLEGKNVPGQL